MLSNGRMLVGINKFGLVHDFYYPYVGLENHTTGPGLRHKVGVWVDGVFSWLDDGTWSIKMDYQMGSMVGITKATHKDLLLTLEFYDFVDCELPVFCRNMHVVNSADRQREVRVFMHQVFQIAESSRGDTALFVPDEHIILDYKGHRAFAIGGTTADGHHFDQYSIGNFGIEGKEGTFRDAEDGVLEGNAVEHGHVDSVVRFCFTLDGHSSSRIHHWIAAAVDNIEALELNQKVTQIGLTELQHRTEQYWQRWLAMSERQRNRIAPEYRQAVTKSLFIMKSHIDRRGAIIASGDSRMLNYARDYYSYFWPRDGAYVIWPLMRLGYREEAQHFFEFCRDVLSDHGFLMHKYLPDRSVGSSWHPYVHEHHREWPIQEDETAIVIFMLGEYLHYSKDRDFVESMYHSLIQPAANFMDEYIDSATKLPHASYDLWEERFQTTTYTTSLVYAALRVAARLANEFQHPDDAIRWETVAEEVKLKSHEMLFNTERNYFYRGFLLGRNDTVEFDQTIDIASLFGVVTFGLFDIDDDRVIAALKTLENELLDTSPSGGLARYENDQYNRTSSAYKGNPWIIATLWYAQLYAEKGKPDVVRERLAWTMNHMLKSGVLPEQINPETSKHVSVVPLIWSHAEFINTVLDITPD